MPSGAIGRFYDSTEYVANLPGMTVDLVVRDAGRFDGQVTWVRLPYIALISAEERLPRVAYVSMQQPCPFVTFVVRPGRALLVNGVALARGEIAFHARGERFHQRTTAAARWGQLTMAPEFVSIYDAAIGGPPCRLPSVGHVVCPASEATNDFLRLHAQICRLVETHPLSIGRAEVARALEQELIHSLMNCLALGRLRPESKTTRRRAGILARFEEQLASHPGRALPVPELCDMIAISQRSLLTYCKEFLGISPSSYILLRRLNRVRWAMLNADPTIAKVGEIARRYGFTELGRFAAAYRTAFGETPSATLLRLRYAQRVAGGHSD